VLVALECVSRVGYVAICGVHSSGVYRGRAAYLRLRNSHRLIYHTRGASRLWRRRNGIFNLLYISLTISIPRLSSQFIANMILCSLGHLTSRTVKCCYSCIVATQVQSKNLAEVRESETSPAAVMKLLANFADHNGCKAIPCNQILKVPLCTMSYKII
jgi:hypothetical protein